MPKSDLFALSPIITSFALHAPATNNFFLFPEKVIFFNTLLFAHDIFFPGKPFPNFYVLNLILICQPN